MAITYNKKNKKNNIRNIKGLSPEGVCVQKWGKLHLRLISDLIYVNNKESFLTTLSLKVQIFSLMKSKRIFS